jgi:hypothetical protein
MPKMSPYLLVVVFGLMAYACTVNDNDPPEPSPPVIPTIWETLAGKYSGLDSCIIKYQGQIDTTYNASSVTIDSISPSLAILNVGWEAYCNGDSIANINSAELYYVWYSSGHQYHIYLDTLTRHMTLRHSRITGGTDYQFTCIGELDHE